MNLPSFDHVLPIATGPSERLGAVPSRQERNVARRNVQQVDSEFFERAQEPLDFTPARFELLLLFRLPIRPNILGKLWARIEVRPGEIQNEWRLDNGHFDHAQIVIGANDLWDIKTQNGGYTYLPKSFIDLFFAPVRLIEPEDFNPDIS